MANENPNTEIEQLRKQLDEMRREREAAAVDSVEPEPNEAAVEEEKTTSGVDEIIDAVGGGDFDLAGHVRHFLDTVDDDLKGAKPSTLLMVFALGVLIGRLR
jgi:alcohol dehydrogenase class IV